MLIEYLFDQTRKVPVIVITHGQISSQPVLPPVQLQQYLANDAQVFSLTPIMVEKFNYRLKQVFGLKSAGVRLYRPGMAWGDHVFTHPLWHEPLVKKRIDAGEDFFAFLKERCAPPIKRFEGGKDCLFQEQQREKREAYFRTIPQTKKPARPVLKLKEANDG